MRALLEAGQRRARTFTPTTSGGDRPCGRRSSTAISDRRRLRDYLEEVREIERRVKQVDQMGARVDAIGDSTEPLNI